VSDIILKNIFYLHQGGGQKDLQHADIYIHNNRISAIQQHIDISRLKAQRKEENRQGLSDDAENDIRVIDCSRLTAVPGLVNTHHHFFQTLTRNIPAVQNAKLFDWLVHLYEIWKGIDEEAVYVSSLLATAELLKTGCTATTDHHYLYPNSFSKDLMGIQFAAAEKTGIRFSPTRGSMSLSRKDGGLPPDTVVQSDTEILEDSLRVIQKYHDDSSNSMRKIVLAPCSPFSVTPDLMRETALLAREYGVRLHTHLAETEDENDFCMETFGKRPLDLMEDCEFIGSDVFYAHGIHFNDNELQRIAHAGAHIAHCPSSNMRLGSGICRVHEMLDMGINVGLAVDGSASNDASDMLGEVRNALLLQRVRYGSEGLNAREAFSIASENGAKLLDLQSSGTIAAGKAADIALFDVHRLEYAGSLSDPLAALIFSGYNHGAEYTIVNGKIVVENGRLAALDEEELSVKANSISKKLLEAVS